MDTPGSILTKDQSTDIINYVHENDNCKFRESESAVLGMKLVIWEVIRKSSREYFVSLD